jgi:UDP-3-O-[3-hydroxymyristoyl] glucosamine N-acyltransferase
MVGDVSMNSKLIVGNDVSLNRKLFVGTTSNMVGDVSMNSKLIVGNDVSLNSKLFVGTTSNMVGDVSMNSKLIVGNDVSLNSKLFVGTTSNMVGDVSMNSKLIVGNDVSLNSKLFVGTTTNLVGDVSMNSKLIVGNDVSLNSKLFVGTTSNMVGDVSMNSKLIVGNDVSLNSKLFVGTTSNMVGDVSMNSKLIVGNDVSLNSKLFVGTSSNMVGDVSMNSKLIVGNDVSLNSKLFVGTTSNMVGDVSMNSKLIVGNDVSLNSKLFVGTTTNLVGDVSMNSKLIVGNDVSLNSKLFVGTTSNMVGDVSMNSKLIVGNDVSFNSKLFVEGDVSLNSNLNVGGILTVNDIIPIGNCIANIGDPTHWFGNLYVYDLIVGPNSITIGDATITSGEGTVNIPGDFQTNGTFSAYGDVSFGSNLNVYGKTILRDDVSLNSKLFVNGDVSMNTNVDISGSLNVITNFKLPVGGTSKRPTTINETLSAGYIRYNTDNHQFEGYGPGNSWGSLGGVINVAQNTKIIASSPNPDSTNNELQFYTAPAGSVATSDAVERMRILANGDISMNGKLIVGGDISLNSKLFVVGDVSMNSGMSVMSDVSFNKKLMVSNDVSFNSKLSVANDVSFNGMFDVNGISHFKSNMYIDEQLLVLQDSSFNGNLHIGEYLKYKDNLVYGMHSNSYYANDNIVDIQVALDKSGAEQGISLFISSGSYGGSDLLITDRQNIGLIAPNTGSAITELPGTRGIVISGATSTRIRMTFLQVRGMTTINGTLGRHYFANMDFVGGFTLTGTTTNYITFNNCSFGTSFTVPNTFAGVIYLINCDFGGLSLTLNNLYSSQQVILNNCTGLDSYPNASKSTLFGLNSLSTGASSFAVGNITAGNDVSLNSKLFVGTTSNMVGDVSMNSKLRVSNDVLFNSKLVVGGDVSMNSNLFVGSNVTIGKKLFVSELEATNFSITGTMTYINVSQLDISDNLIRLNKNGVSTVGSGIEIESAGNTVGAYIKLDNTEKWTIMSPGQPQDYIVTKTRVDIIDASLIEVRSRLGQYSYNLSDTTSIDRNVVLSNSGYKLSVLGDASLNNRLFINGDVSFNSRLTVRSDVSLNSKLFVASDVSFGSKLFVQGISNMVSDVSMNSRLFVNGDVSFNSRLTVRSDASFNSRLFVGSDVSLGSKLFVAADVSMNSRLSVGGSDSSFNGNLYIGKVLTVANKATFGMPPTNALYELDISGQMRIYETIGTAASATSGSLTFEHADPSGVSSIVFKSKNASASDYAYIQYQENVGGTGAGPEKGLLTIGIENDPTTSNTMDRISIYSAGGAGYVGINTKDPLYNFDVNGSSNLGNVTSNNFIGGNVNLSLPNDAVNTVFAGQITTNNVTISVGSFMPSFYNGVYDFSASSFNGFSSPFRAFDRITGNAWFSSISGDVGPTGVSYNQNPYSSVSPYAYQGGTAGNLVNNYFTTVVSGQTISGEWLQVKLPYAFAVKSYIIYYDTTIINTALTFMPSQFYLAGSNDGITWAQIDYKSYQQGFSRFYFSYSLTTQSANYTYFRLIITHSGSQGVIKIGDLVLTGYPSALTIGKTTVGNDLQLFGKLITTNTQVSGNLIYTNRPSQDYLDPSFNSMKGYYALDNEKVPLVNYEVAKQVIANWTARYNPGVTISSVIWCSKLMIFCAVGSGNSYISSDGITWTSSVIQEGITYNDVAWSNELNLFCAVGQSNIANSTNLIATSPNGITWTVQTHPPVQASSGLKSIDWSPEYKIFNVVGYYNTNGFQRSYDGINWTALGSNGNGTSVVWASALKRFMLTNTGGGMGIGFNQGTDYYSNFNPSVYSNKLVWSEQLGILVNFSQGSVYTSYDGITWNIVENFAPNGVAACCWAAELGMFCLIDSDEKLYTSQNGLEWVFVKTLSEYTGSIGNKSLCWSPELGIFCFAPSAGQSFFTSSLKTRIPTAYNTFNSAFNRIDEFGNWTFDKNLSINGNISLSNIGTISSNVNIGGNMASALTAPVSAVSVDVSNQFVGTNVSISGILPSFYNGTYTISSSSDNNISSKSYQAFDNSFNTAWSSNASVESYDSANSYYNSKTKTAVQTVGDVSGAWVQINLPYSFNLTSYTISNYTGTTSYSPAEVYLVGSNDNSVWYLVNTSVNGFIPNNSTTTFNVSNANYYTTYRLIVKRTAGNSRTIISGLSLYGYPLIGTSTIGNDMKVFGNVNLYKDVSMNGKLFVGSDVSLNINVDISGSLNVLTNLKLPVGGTNKRPTTINETLSAGYIRYNTDNHQFEGYGPGNSWGSLGGVVNVAQNTKIMASSPNADSTNNELQFYTAPAGSLSSGDTVERMRILANGDISMNAKLRVGGDVSLNSKLSVADTLTMTNNASIVLKESSSNITYPDATIQTSAYTGAGSLAGTYGTPIITIDTQGRIAALSSGIYVGMPFYQASITTSAAYPPIINFGWGNYYNWNSNVFTTFRVSISVIYGTNFPSIYSLNFYLNIYPNRLVSSSQTPLNSQINNLESNAINGNISHNYTDATYAPNGRYFWTHGINSAGTLGAGYIQIVISSAGKWGFQIKNPNVGNPYIINMTVEQTNKSIGGILALENISGYDSYYSQGFGALTMSGYSGLPYYQASLITTVSYLPPIIVGWSNYASWNPNVFSTFKVSISVVYGTNLTSIYTLDCYLNIYPYRLVSASQTSLVTKTNDLDSNAINGNTSLLYTDPTYSPNGRYFWAHGINSKGSMNTGYLQMIITDGGKWGFQIKNPNPGSPCVINMSVEQMNKSTGGTLTLENVPVVYDYSTQGFGPLTTGGYVGMPFYQASTTTSSTYPAPVNLGFGNYTSWNQNLFATFKVSLTVIYGTNYASFYSLNSYIDIYPYRLVSATQTPANVQINNLETNAINGNTSLTYTDPTYAPNGRYFWAHEITPTGTMNAGYVQLVISTGGQWGFQIKNPNPGSSCIISMMVEQTNKSIGGPMYFQNIPFGYDYYTQGFN